MERKLKDYATLVLKGMGMGAADVVPWHYSIYCRYLR